MIIDASLIIMRIISPVAGGSEAAGKTLREPDAWNTYDASDPHSDHHPAFSG
jgi:hypothetical protein